MKSYWFRIFRFRRRRRTNVRSSSVLFRRYSMFEGLELRSMLSGDGLGDSALVADDIHASPLEQLSITQLMASNLAQDGAPTAEPLAATENNDPVADPLVEGIVGQTIIKFTDLSGNEITEITAGQNFKVEVYVDDLRTVGGNFGFYSAFARLNFETTDVQLIASNPVDVGDFFDDLVPLITTGTAGAVIAGGASTSGTAPGTAPQLLYTATFTALTSGATDFSTSFYEDVDNVWQQYGSDDVLTVDNVTFDAASLTVEAQPTLSIGNVSQNEGNTGNSNFLFTVTLSEPAAGAVTVQYATQAGTAAGADPGQDFVPQSGTITFEQGTTVKVITISVVGDTTSESNETFNVLLSSPVGATIAAGTGLGTIQNDDLPVISIGNVSQDEGDAAGTMVFTVSLSAPAAGTVSVAYATGGGTATAGNDYAAVSGTITFSAGETVKTITVTVNGDTTEEGNETFLLTLSSPTGATLNGGGVGTGTLVNDDGNVVSVTPTAVSQPEGDSNSNMVFTVKLAEAASENVVVVYNTANGTATAGSDYTATSGTLTFAPGVTELLVTVQILGDNLDEADETFSLVLSAPQNASIAAGTAVGTIQDDDGPAITVTGPASVNENSGAYVVTVSLASVSNQQVTVVYNTANGTATSGSDYTATSGTLTFAPGETSKLITIALTGDTTKESNETFTINLTNAVNAELPTSPFTATIANDDDVPTVEVIAPSSQNEGNSGSTPFVFTVKLSGASDSQVTVAYSTSNAIAQAGSDYTATSGTLTFAPGQTQLLVTVLVTGDTLVENSNETFRLDLTNPSGATLKSGGNTATAVIVDDDSAPIISISDASVSEGDSGTKQLVFTVTLTNPSTSNVTVQYATQDGTAASNGDYTATSGTLTFAANETVKTITVNIVGDLFNEEDETFRVLLSNATNASIGDAAGIGTILDEAGDSVNVVPSTITGKVFIDSNSDGTQSGIEKSLAGVTVNLTGAATRSTTTNADGSYSFGNLQPGTYTIKVVMPNQYKTATALLGNDGGSLVDGGFTFTIENPGGVTANDYHFTTKGLKAAFLSMRNFMASYLDSDSESVGQVSVSISTVTNPINASNAANTTISGTGTVGASISVVASSGSTSTAAATTTVDANGTWTISGINVTTLPDGTVTYTVTATENGTTDTETITATKDTVAPTVDATSVTNPVNSGNDDSTSVSGTGTVGATVSVVASDGTNSTAAKTAVVGSNGQWTVSGVDVTALANGTLTYTATISDANGNTATDTITTTKDSEAPSLTVNTVPPFINASTQGDFSLSGTATAGATVTIAFAGINGSTIATRNVTVGASGNWTVEDIDLTSLPDGTVTFTITATDAASNTTQIVRSSMKNTVIAVAIADATDPVNAANKTAASINGTGEVGASIVVVITDGENEVTTTAVVVGSNGTWNVTGIDLSSLDDGEITYKVTATDEAGNTKLEEIDAVKDTVAPALEIETVTNPINIGNADAVSISGTGEVGAVISVVVSDGTNQITVTQTATVDSEGNWTITGINVSTLEDGTLTFTVKATDAVGNFTEDTIESVMTTLNVADVTDPITQANETDVTISGTGQPGATVEVVVSIGDDETTVYSTEIAEDGTWSISEIDVSDLADGEVTFTVTAIDGEDEVEVTITAEKDTVATGEIIDATDPVSSGNQTAASITGEAEDGSTVTVRVTDGEITTTETTAAFAAGIWSLANINLTSLADGDITYIVKITDALGNVTEYQFEAVKDTVAPELEVNDVAGPIGIAGQDSVSITGTSEANASIKVIVSNGDDSTIEYSATANASGEWTVSGIDVSELADGTLTFTVTAIDAAGNETEDDSVTVVKRTLAASNLEDTISQVNQETVTVSGTGDPAATISIIARNGAQSTAAVEVEVDEDGNWTAVIDVSDLADGTITFEITASVGADSVETTITGTKDTLAEGVILGATDPVNSENKTAAAINGTSQVGSTVQVSVTDGVIIIGPTSATVAGDGTWSLTGIDLSTLAEGNITYKVKVTDALGNVTEYTRTALKDTVAPSLTIADVTDPIEIFNVAAVDISGTGEAGATITVVVTNGANSTAPRTAIVDSEGNWSITDIDVSSLADGTLTFEVSAEDAAGNFTEDTIEATKTTVQIVGLPDAIKDSNKASVTVTGTGLAGASVVVVASDGTHQVTAAAVIIDEAGEWSVTMDLSSLDDGEVTFTATATDGDDSAEDSATTLKDTVATGSILAATNPVNGVTAEAAAINGTAEVGSTVEVTIIGGADDDEVTVGPVSAAVAGDGTWSLTGLNLSTLPDGPIRYEIKVTDQLGNVDPYTLNALKDTLVTVSIVTPNGSEVTAENAIAFTLAGQREAGAEVEISVTDGVHTVTATVTGPNATWSKVMDLSTLDNGTLTVLVTATDAAGNEISDTIELEKGSVITEVN